MRSFCTDKMNQKPVKENLDNPENVPDKDIIYFIRSYFACHGRSYTYSARNKPSVTLVESYRDNLQYHWHHPRFRFGIRLPSKARPRGFILVAANQGKTKTPEGAFCSTGVFNITDLHISSIYQHLFFLGFFHR